MNATLFHVLDTSMCVSGQSARQGQVDGAVRSVTPLQRVAEGHRRRHALPPPRTSLPPPRLPGDASCDAAP